MQHRQYDFKQYTLFSEDSMFELDFEIINVAVSLWLLKKGAGTHLADEYIFILLLLDFCDFNQ